MNGYLPLLLAVVFFVIVSNFFMLYMRTRKDRRPKSGRAAMSESEAMERRDRDIRRRIDLEQEECARQVELRNKTLDLYEQVRRKAAAAEEQGEDI